MTSQPIQLDGLNAKMLAILASKGCAPVTEYDTVKRISTGSLALDYAIGGGFPRGRLTTLVGDPGFGKTTLATLAASVTAKDAGNMLNGGRTAFFDMENTYDPGWAAKLGIDPRLVHLFQPDSGEAFQDAVTAMLEEKIYDLIVLDSVSGTPFNAELEGSADDSHVGVGARKWHQFFRSRTGTLAQSNTALLFLNTTTYGIGKFNPTGQPLEEYGGRAITRAASIRISLQNPERDEEGVITFRAKTKKNKTASWPREARIEVIVGSDRVFVNPVSEIVSVGKDLGVFTKEDGSSIKGGGYWYYQGEQLAIGEKAVRSVLIDKPDLRQEIIASIRVMMDNANRIARIDGPEEEYNGAEADD